MLHGSTSPGPAGSELTRLLAQLAHPAEAPPADRRPAFAERLGLWLGWTGAIALSAALDAGPDARALGLKPVVDRAEADFERVQAALEAGIAAGLADRMASPTEFGPYRRHCVAQQQAMSEAVAALRQRLREALAQRSPHDERLAAIDAVMDQALAGRERSLLGLVPQRLQSHFERLQRTHGTTGAAAEAWAKAFGADMDRVLRAELAHRLLPARGLLDTLRTPSAT